MDNHRNGNGCNLAIEIGALRFTQHQILFAFLEKLFALVLIAFTWAYPVGIYLNEK
jgi:hypothetical protein